jgi:hypothetical protein
VPELVREEIGVLGMKSMVNGAIVRAGVATAVECLRYALTLPTSVVITGMETLAELDQACDVASSFEPMTAVDVASLLARTKPASVQGRIEIFKTTTIFDATATNPEWLGEEPDRVKRMIPQVDWE